MNGSRKKSWLTSILIILSYLALWAIVLPFAGTQRFLDGFIYYVWQLSYIGFVAIILYHVAIPMVRRRGRRVLRISIFTLTSFLLVVIGYQAWIWLGARLTVLPLPAGEIFNTDAVVRSLLFEIFSLAYFAAIRLYIDSVQLRLSHKQLQVEKKISELNYLKSQTNPHFLFNTLNNIYALSRNKSDKAPESLLRLSALLRYMLYETSAHRIPIEKELSIIEDYLELEKLRYDGTLDLVFSRELDNKNIMLPPLILLPLIENAFKHGASETQHYPYVHINLVVRDHRLVFIVNNSCVPAENISSGHSGIGLHNLQHQLRLLYTDYSLELNPQPESFSAALTINLASHASL